MVNAIFYKKNEDIVAFKLKGHAEYQSDGYDLVCSAVSAVSQTTLIGIMEVLHIKCEYHIEDGFLSLSIEKFEPSKIKSCQVLLETTLLGMKSMELSYGDYIKVNVEEV